MVIGVGNALRGDDAAGLVVARRARERGVRAIEQEGEPVGLIEAFTGHPAVVVVDAVRSGAPPGTVHRADVSDAPLPAPFSAAASTHTLGLAEAIELARALDRLPPRIVVFGVEGASFDTGAELSPAVAGALDALVEAVVAELGEG